MNTNDNIDLFDRLYRDACRLWWGGAISLAGASLAFPVLLFSDGALWKFAAVSGGTLLVIAFGCVISSNYLRRIIRIHFSKDLPVYFPNSKLAKRFVSDRL